ncbi:MAG: adenylate/guanylate cyclase domain-containing protein, partial [Gammaproteobacteria bacterium]
WDPGFEETLPTMPLAALLAYNRPHFRSLIEALSTAQPVSPEVLELIDLLRTEHLPRIAMGLRRLLASRASLAQAVTQAIANGRHLDAGARSALLALIRAMGGSDTLQLNHYGPPGTLKTFSYQCVLAGACADPAGDVATGLRGRAVFVGYSSAWTGEVHDQFQTVYGRSSGVEISATAFANLLEQNPLRTLPMVLHVLFIAVWSVLLAQLVTRASTRSALLVLAGTASAYLALNYAAFVRLHLWLPLAVPLFIQAPLAAGARLWQGYRDERAERARVQIELSRIEDGLRVYLPQHVVTRIATNTDLVLSEGQVMYGVCIHSDAGQFTKLSETMKAVSLRALLNAYYEPLFDAVSRHQGWVSDVVGDAMLAVWPTTGPDPEAKRSACRAALDVLRATRAPGRVALPTRIGIHCGELVLGNVGARGRFEYRAVGEVVNKAERIERTNKRLGTALLASGEVARGLDTLITRELGCFYLPGTSRAIDLYEVIDPETGDLAVAQEKRVHFGAGLAAFRLRDYARAQRMFARVIDEFGPDGPALFYLELCARFGSLPPQASWDGCVPL